MKKFHWQVEILIHICYKRHIRKSFIPLFVIAKILDGDGIIHK